MILAFALAAQMLAVATLSTSNESRPGNSARILAAGDPVAVITPMPDYVSNGTWVDLNASGSHDTDGGVILNYTWEIILGGSNTTYLYGQIETFKFKTLGLYKISLTVTDNESKTDEAFTAVVSVLDSDQDMLPDWWEMKYFFSLGQTANGDPDNDKYTNIEEYASGTDPTKKDPRPTLFHMIKDNWMILVIAAAIIVGAIVAMLPFLKRKRKQREKRKIEAAIAIEKALEEEGK